jgi:hypothetical protein
MYVCIRHTVYDILYDVHAVLKNSPYLPHDRIYGYTVGYTAIRFWLEREPVPVDLSFSGLAPTQAPYTTAPIRLLTNCT